MAQSGKESAAMPANIHDQMPAFPMKPGAETAHLAPGEQSAALPPGMASIKQYSADEVLKMMNRMPLFMTTLDETDGEGGENVELEALKALAYEGTRAEVAGNFREQGNECAREKDWTNAKEYYDKALAALKGERKQNEIEGGEAEMDLEGEREVIDLEEEERKEKEIEEACYVNRALCHLEKKNYRSCIFDCASTLRLNPKNIKALYRSSLACLALDKIPEALDACTLGLSHDPQNKSLLLLQPKIEAREKVIAARTKAREEREARALKEKQTLEYALKARGIKTRRTDKPPEMEDAQPSLQNPVDASSTLSLPVLFLYPLVAQSDLIKACQEDDTLLGHLTYIFPAPWDQKAEYDSRKVECYIETVSGGLIKAGKKLALLKFLVSGKVEIVDGLLKVYVVPASESEGWVKGWKSRKP